MTDTYFAAFPGSADENEPGQLTVEELADLDWDGDGQMRYGTTDADKVHDNTRRAGRALRVVELYASDVVSGGAHTEPTEQHIGDLLGDIRHLCDALELDFESLIDSGLMHYRDEARGIV